MRKEIDDPWNSGTQAYHDSTTGEDGSPNELANKITKRGCEVTAIDDFGIPTVEKVGDTSGALFFAPNTRDFGTWSYAVPVVISEDLQAYPVKNTTLAADTTYSGKAVVDNSPVNDYTKVQNATGGEVEAGQVGIVLRCLNRDSWEQVFIATGTAQIIKARVCWNYGKETDLSEAEIVSQNEEGEWVGTESLVWIDWQKSAAVQFETCGDGTIFAIELVKQAVIREGVERNLYRVVRCLEDFGSKITHVETHTQYSAISDTVEGVKPTPSTGQKFTMGNALQCYYLSQDLTAAYPWDDRLTSRIYTTIGSEAKLNQALARVPIDWDVARGEDFAFMELMESGRGLPYFFQPINPELVNIELRKYAFIDNDGNTIAQYRRVSDSG